MKFTLDRKILVGFIFSAILLLGVAIVSFRNSEKFVATNFWVNHTHEVLYELKQILVYAVDAETGERGYIITGDKNYLEPYNKSKEELLMHLNRAKALTTDNPLQQKNLADLTPRIDTLVSHLEKCIAVRQTDGFAESQKLLETGFGKLTLDDIRNRLDGCKAMEDSLMADRIKTSKEDVSSFTSVFIVLMAIIGVVLLVVYVLITTNLKALRKAELESANKNWNLSGNGELTRGMQGNKPPAELAQSIINYLCQYLDAQVGAFYVAQHDKNLKLMAGHAMDKRKIDMGVVSPGEGIVGQAAAQNRTIELLNVPKGYFNVDTGFGKVVPRHIIATPFVFENEVLGVIELGSIAGFNALQQQFLPVVLDNIAIAIASSLAREKMKELLEETQRQAEELETQQEELRQLNEELEEHAQNLKQQQEELQITNEELEEQSQALEVKNREMENARVDIELKTKQLEVSSRYKSEFLANMSHELRTPLNSLLILSKDLADNKKANLSEEQVESAKIIHHSGHDLLGLINEVLDLSKIEAGKMDLRVEQISLKEFGNDLTRNFKHQADNKKLAFSVTLADGLPATIKTDGKRLDQVIKNLLSNAIKFTDSGSVQVNIQKAGNAQIAISVKDTGIGVPVDKQMAIFEAFHQGDGSTSRKYGGTGLGLSISRELVKLLGGEISVSSKINEGSTFTITIPVELQVVENTDTEQREKEMSPKPKVFAPQSEYYNYPTIADDRYIIQSSDKVLLIVEDDLKFADILLKQAHNKGFKGIAASTGEDGLLLAEKYRPHAIILDMHLPGIDGKQVLTELKTNPALRHIPVHIASVNERTLEPIKEGAVEYLTKPIDKGQLEEAFNRIENFINRKMKNLLIIEDNENSRKAIKLLIGNGDVKCLEAGTGKQAIEMFRDNHIDCIVLDLGLPDMSGFELIYKLEKVKDGQMPPIIIYTGKELSRQENEELQKYAETVIIKGIRSEERLLDETALFLHRTISNLPESKQKIITGLYDKESVFVNKKILLVDDDMRNVFALSKVLKEHNMEISKAENGRVAVEILNSGQQFDMVLMDIMMPEMDGYEAMQKIRSQQRFKQLPIIALTAKAMKDDRQKCLDAGANDYIPKPVDVDRLLSLMRVWLSK